MDNQIELLLGSYGLESLIEVLDIAPETVVYLLLQEGLVHAEDLSELINDPVRWKEPDDQG